MNAASDPTEARPSSLWIRPSATEWCCLAAGLVFAFWYAWIMDDAYIYFRYVDNFLFLDYGLVHNQGEFVEGFSSPLWCMVLIALRATHLDYWLIVRAVAVLSYFAFWWAMIRLNRRMAPKRGPALNLPLILLTSTYGYMSYFSSGLESPLIQLTAVAFAFFVLNPASRPLQIVVALGPLVRPEFALPLLIALAWQCYRLRAVPYITLIAAGLTTGGYEFFRIWYYADLFPNTFYLKNVSDAYRGFGYVHDALWPYLSYAIFPALLVLGLVIRRRLAGSPPVDRAQFAGAERLVMLAIGLSVAAYVVKIGGDARHFRYLAFSYGLVFMAAAGLAEWGLAALGQSRRRPWAIATALVLGVVVALMYPRQLEYHPFLREGKAGDIDGIREAYGHRRLEYLTPPPFVFFYDFNLDAYAVIEGERPVPYTGIFTTYFCNLAYRAFDRRNVHSLGLTEPILARTEIDVDSAAHKYGLEPMAEDLAAVLKHFDNKPFRGMYRQAVDEGIAADWIAKNIDTIEAIERKTLNEHRFFENLRLAFTPVGRVYP